MNSVVDGEISLFIFFKEDRSGQQQRENFSNNDIVLLKEDTLENQYQFWKFI